MTKVKLKIWLNNKLECWFVKNQFLSHYLQAQVQSQDKHSKQSDKDNKNKNGKKLLLK